MVFLCYLGLSLLCTTHINAAPLKEKIQQQKINNQTSGYYCLCGAGIFTAIALIINVDTAIGSTLYEVVTDQNLLSIAGSIQGLVAQNTSNLLVMGATYLTAMGITKRKQAYQLKCALRKAKRYPNNQAKQQNHSHIHLWLESPHQRDSKSPEFTSKTNPPVKPGKPLN